MYLTQQELVGRTMPQGLRRKRQRKTLFGRAYRMYSAIALPTRCVNGRRKGDAFFVLGILIVPDRQLKSSNVIRDTSMERKPKSQRQRIIA
jgi:hypothetical protein